MADSGKKGKGKPQGGQKEVAEKAAAPAEKKEVPPKENKPKEAPQKGAENKKEGGAPKDNKQNKPQNEKAAAKKEEVKESPAEVVVPAVVEAPKDQPETPVAAAATPAADASKDKPKREPRPEKQYVKGKGIVKAVKSGDTIIVVHLEKGKPPSEKEITLTNITAPRLGKKNPMEPKEKPTEDEPWAWQSREFLRKKVIGQSVSYSIETVANTKNYGIVYLIQKNGKEEDVARLVVSEGWARVRKPNLATKDLREDVMELVQAEEAAQKDGKGVFQKESQHSKRRFPHEIQTTELFDKLKGTPQTGVIEKVLSGSALRIVFLPAFHDVILHLSGVEAPQVRKKGKVEEFEPFAREAKFLTEYFLLNREVQIILEGVDTRNLYGTVSLEGNNISEELLKRGLAHYVDWSGQRTAFSDRLKSAEKSAKEHKLGIWGNYVEPKPLSRQEEKKQLKTGKEILGKVVEVISAGTIVILDANNTPHKINLSSIKQLRGGSMALPDKKEKEHKEQAAEITPEAPSSGRNKGKTETKEERERSEAIERSFAWEAKEYMRKRLIGQRVRCVFDYTKAPLEEKDKTKEPLPDKAYFSVYVDKNNIGVELVSLGLARPAEHRGAEARSKDFEDILKADALAKKAMKGINTPKDKAAIIYINDISLDANKAKQFLPFLRKPGRQRGVVEYEFSASRLKVLVPKESCQLILSISGVKTPQKTEPLAKDALSFTRNKLHQHDIEFEVVTQDKHGNFIGNAWINKENLATLLLTEGYGQVIRSVVRDSDFNAEYTAAEEVAKKLHKNMWKDYDEVKEAEARNKRMAEFSEHKKSSSKQEFIDVIVTEVVDASKFYVQIVGPEAEQLEELMKGLAQKELGEPFEPKVRDLVRAQFTSDDTWYRARVTGKTADGQFQVFYLDYGNSETIPTSRIRQLDAADTKLPPQAKEAHLAYIKPPTLDEEYGTDAAEFLTELVEGKTMMANVEYRDGDVLFLSLGDRESQVHVNAALLRAGLARVERVKGKHLQPLLEKLKEEEDKARQSHAYIWEYGDPGSDEDEEPKKGGKPEVKKPTKAPVKGKDGAAPAKGKDEE